MAVVRMCALEQLAAVLTAAIPELAGKVCISTPLDNHTQTLPSMAIDWAGAVKYEPLQTEDVAHLPADADHLTPRAVFNVGAHEGMVQIRVLAGTPRKRNELAQAVVDVFTAALDDYGYPRPGVLATQVTDCGDVPWTASFELEQDTWINMLAFERQHEGLIEVTGIVPALVTRAGIYTMEDLRLGLTSNLSKSYTSDTMQPPAVEVVRINEDGTLTTL
jgi:hypothetical protein